MTTQSQEPPAVILRNLMMAMRGSRALCVAAQLGVADLLADGPQRSGELAAKAGANPETLRRLLRALVSLGVFAEDSPDHFSLNPAAALLRDGVPGSQRAGVLFLAGDLRWELWSELLESVRTGDGAIERAFGKNLFDRLKENATESALFDQAMAAFSAALSPAVVAARDYSQFGRIADIGGGTGRQIADILAANPSVHGILFDLPNVVANAPPLLRESGTADRCEIVAGSFFDGVPAGVDAYLIKHVLHDWDDASCVTILSHIRQAMRPDSQLLIVERVMPERAEAGVSVEAHMLDLEMLISSPGGRERSEQDFRSLLTSSGLTLTSVVSTAAPVSIVEAQLA